eukprot:1161699-Pelagomonas_calceolata.AAC.4
MQANPIKQAYRSMTNKPPAAPSNSSHKSSACRTSNESNPPYLLGGKTSDSNQASSKGAMMKATSEPQHVHPSTDIQGTDVHGDIHHMSAVPLSNPLPSSNSSSAFVNDCTVPEPPPCAWAPADGCREVLLWVGGRGASADAGREVLLFVGMPPLLDLDKYS